MEKLLEMKEICKSFGTNNVLKNVQFDLFAGEVHCKDEDENLHARFLV